MRWEFDQFSCLLNKGELKKEGEIQYIILLKNFIKIKIIIIVRIDVQSNNATNVFLVARMHNYPPEGVKVRDIKMYKT